MLQSQRWLSTAMLFCLTHNLASTHREHKVHNIVLYPDKHSWCKTTPIKQVVAYPGCESIEIDNNVCVGACFSYAIPRTMPSAPGELIKPYCDSCQPSSVVWQHVTLTCESDENIFERVQMIENCSCSACFTGEETNDPQVESSGDGDLYSKPSLIDVPELMDLMMETHNTRRHFNESFSRNVSVTKQDPILNERLLLLLKQFSDDNDLSESNLDKVALKELLRRVEGVDHRVNQVTLAELVNWIEDTEHILVDLPKLKQILARFAHEENEKQLLRDTEVPVHHDVHRHQSHHHHHHHHVPVENNHHVQVENHHVPTENNHHNVLVENNHHVPVESNHQVLVETYHHAPVENIHHVPVENNHQVLVENNHRVPVENNHHVPVENSHHVPVENHHHHHHHSHYQERKSDEVMSVTEKKVEESHIPSSGPVKHLHTGHDGVDPTLDVAPHHLTPALEGTELSYHENIVADEQTKADTET